MISRTSLNIVAACAMLAAIFALATSLQAQSPNVVFIVADDAGYADFGFMNGLSGETSEIPTPNLDALASRGVTFSRAYVSPSCQPTRAALVTGGYQNRIGNEVVGNNLTSASGVFEGVPLATETIWDRMKSVGYTTGAVGKWHLGQIEDTPTQLGNRPQNQGVDEFYGIWHGSRGYNVGNTNGQTQTLREAIVQPNGTITDVSVEAAHAGEYITNTFGQYGVDFIADHHADANPFFLYQSFTAPHTPLQNSPDFNDPSLAHLSGTRKTYGSMMLTMDKEIGRILDRLDDPNGDGNTSDSIADDTMVVFINDNGGADAQSSSPNGADNGNLRRGKGAHWEGGIRVPMIIAGAGINAPAEGTTYSQPVHGVDILPTAFVAGGGSFGASDTGIDGVNLLPHINGTNTAAPHEVIVSRQRSQWAVIKGDMKLVWTGGTPGANPQLYNVVTDVSETMNIASANPTLVAEMKRDLTDHEVVWDKQRYAILGRTAEATINLFDHFTFKPNGSGGGGGGSSFIIDGSTGNGDFNAGGGTGPTADPQTYTQTVNWFNAGGSEGINFTNLTQMGGSTQAQSRGGMPFQNRVQVNDSGYTITSAGEVFNLSYDFGAGGGLAGWDGDEMMRTFLFTTNSTVDGNLTAADINELAADVYAVDRAGDGQWTQHEANSFYVTTAADIGKTIYFGMEFEDPNVANTLFPRIDVVSLEVVGGSGPVGVQTTNWSSTGAWFEGGTNTVETMFYSDSFAGAVLEFATEDAFSYVSNNDMVRLSGQEFMLNKMVLSGTFAGSQSQYATIEGNAVLFAKSLDGVGPRVDIDAVQGATSYDYNVDLDLVMYDDLTIGGNGSVGATVNG